MENNQTVAELQDRVTKLESALAHHQYEYDALNHVVIEQSERIEQLTRRLDRLEADLRDVREHIPDERDPVDEKPPHY